MKSEKYPYQKAWQRHRLKTALALMLAVMFIAGFYFSLKFMNVLGEYVARELILGLFAGGGLLVLVFALHTRFWRCPRCRYKPLFPLPGKYYERICVKCGLNKYEGSSYFDGKIKIRINNF